PSPGGPRVAATALAPPASSGGDAGPAGGDGSPAGGSSAAGSARPVAVAAVAAAAGVPAAAGVDVGAPNPVIGLARRSPRANPRSALRLVTDGNTEMAWRFISQAASR